MHRQPWDGHCSIPLASARVVACLAFLAGGALSLEGHAQMQPFTPQEKTEIVAKLLRGTEMQALAAEAPEKIRVLSVVSAEAEEVKQRAENQVARRLAEVVLIQYQTGAAFRVRVDVESGKALSVDPLRGRPQSSQEEREESRALIRRSLSLPEGLDLVGGFVVDPPPGAPARGRYLEFHVVGTDRLKIEREVIFDLLTGKVVADRRRDGNA